jgi:tetratricopeptide (TPR) repeat protein
MKRLWKLSAVLLTAGLLIGGLGNSFQYAQENRNTEKADKKAETEKEKQALEEGLIPIPVPQLEHLEKAVSRQLGEGRRMVEAITNTLTVEPKKRAASYAELGLLYHAYGLTEAADACYSNALSLDPENYEWNYRMAELYQKVGKFEDAIQRFKKAKDVLAETEADRIYVLAIRLGECYRNLNRPEEAKQSYEEAYRKNPDGPAVLARLGEIALGEKRYDEAVGFFQKALDNQPGANKLYYSLAMAYRGKGDMKLARQFLAKRGMVGVQPPDPLKVKLANLKKGYRVHILDGRLAYAAGHYDTAAEFFKKATDADPKEVGARINLGTTLAKMKRYDEAIKHFLESIQIAPENVTAHYNLGALYNYFGKYQLAVRHLKKVVELKPEDADAHIALGDALRKLNLEEDAYAHYERAVKVRPDIADGWRKMSKMRYSSGKYAESLKILEDAHSRLPLDGLIAHDLARQLATTPKKRKRQGKRALGLALKVYKAAPHYEHARTVAMAYAQLNQCDKAEEWMQLAMDIAYKADMDFSVIIQLRNNLEYLKNNRPCRPPGRN